MWQRVNSSSSLILLSLQLPFTLLGKPYYVCGIILCLNVLPSLLTKKHLSDRIKDLIIPKPSSGLDVGIDHLQLENAVKLDCAFL